MRGVFGMLMAGGLVLGMASLASAQDSLNAFGGYPAGITTGSNYGYYPGGYSPIPPISVQPSWLGTTSYSAGYYGMAPNTVNPSTMYSPYTSSYPLYAYPSASSYAPYYGAAPTYVWPRGGVLRGMIGASRSR